MGHLMWVRGSGDYANIRKIQTRGCGAAVPASSKEAEK